MSAFMKQDPMTGGWRPTFIGFIAIIFCLLFFAGGVGLVTKLFCQAIEEITGESPNVELPGFCFALMAFSLFMHIHDKWYANKQSSLHVTIFVVSFVVLAGFFLYSIVFN